jgi:hypothetical protein
MKAKIALMTICCVAASGCATVDFVEAASRPGAQASVAASPNVVQRAASKLYAAFTNRGWGARSSKRRVQSAADILLRGLDNTSDDGPLNAYAAKAQSLSRVQADMLTAQNYIDQTSKAGEVYLAMANADADLGDELVSLQKALLVARQSEQMFETTLSKFGDGNQETLVVYAGKVDRLRDVTDQFGDRVRQGGAFASAASDNIN